MGQVARGQSSVQTIAMLGNHLPRQCGIATFTTDLSAAIELEVPSIDCFVVAMNDFGVRHTYPSRVRFEIPEREIDAYRRAAEYLNVNSVDVVSVQHEYGIFGGQAGEHLLEFLRALRMPIVTTLHTILAQPDASQRAVLEAVVELSERIVVMSSDGAALLQSVHGVDPKKIEVIPHGIPVVPSRSAIDKVHDGSNILTFGLLSPDKGIEYVIEAMPALLARHPNTIYTVLGATHPHVRAHHGEAYRHSLQAQAEQLGVSSQVIFDNRFVSHEELVEFLSAADLYVTPYLKEEQSTSGTLAYAVGCGKAVISTPYRYARELLAEGRGVLVPWRDSQAIGKEIIDLLDNPSKRIELQARASAFGKSMGWPVVARRYVECFKQARATHAEHKRMGLAAIKVERRRVELPQLDLAHVRLLTDDTGILQHATFDIPRYEDGYCLDDNARALLLMTHIEETGTEFPSVVRSLATRYLAFVDHALDKTTGRFRNFLTYSRTWHLEPGSDDSHGRALWALGAVAGRTADFGRRGLSMRLFHRALNGAIAFTSPRSWAYTLLGIEEYLRTHSSESGLESMRALLTDRLVERFQHTCTDDWPWFEDRLTYCNARLAQGLMVSAARMGDREMALIAERSLVWLVKQHVAADGSFAPIGSDGFYVRGGPRAMFDQQPVEACAMVSACLDAYLVTKQTRWLDNARWAFQWFLGENPLQTRVYDTETGGCRDGIHADRMNENQGAESTLSFLTALIQMRAIDRRVAKTPSILAGAISKGRTRTVPPALVMRGSTS